MGVILSRITLIKPQTQKTQRVCFLEKRGCLIEGAPTARILVLMAYVRVYGFEGLGFRDRLHPT